MKIPKIIQKISPIKNYVNKMATIPANDNRINLPDSRIIDLGDEQFVSLKPQVIRQEVFVY
jgi:hypothetical protein